MTPSLRARRVHAADRRHPGAPDAGDPRRRDGRPPLRPARTAARELGIHVIGTEENPDGLGPLVPEIAALCDTTLAKFHFSAPAEEGFLRRLPAGRDTLVVAGCEAHVCVLQTVDRPARTGSCGEVGRRRGRLAPSARPPRRDRARAQARRRRRHDRDGDLRVARHQRASEVQAALATDPLSRARGVSRQILTTIRPRTPPASSAPALAIASSSGTSSVMRSSAPASRSRARRSPRFLAQRERRHHAVDAGERHAAQDERHHRRRQVEALGEAAGGDDAAVARLRERVGERVAADRVDRRRPALLLQRLAGRAQLGAVDDLGGAELAQVRRLLGRPVAAAT